VGYDSVGIFILAGLSAEVVVAEPVFSAMVPAVVEVTSTAFPTACAKPAAFAPEPFPAAI